MSTQQIRSPEEIMSEIEEGASEYALRKGQRKGDPLAERDEFMKTADGQRLYQEYVVAKREQAENPRAFRTAPVEQAPITKADKNRQDVIAKVNARVENIRKSDSKLSKSDALAKVFAADRALYDEYLAATEVSTGGAVAV